ncbi:MAG: hypothetical protein ACTSWY_14100 [Promethearchaeota archaeon]
MNGKGRVSDPKVLRKKFRFIRDNVFLVACVDEKTGKQEVEFQKIDLKTGQVEIRDKIRCIHTAICNIPMNKFKDTIKKKDFNNEMLRIRSSEGLRRINLAPEEKFKALKSWVGGIAEAGMDAFKIQEEIEKANRFFIPLANKLMQFMLKVEKGFIYNYLDKIERECQFEGIKHEASMIACLLPVLKFITSGKANNIEFQKILSAIFTINPPLKLFTKNKNFLHFLRFPIAVKMQNFDKLFYNSDFYVRATIADNPKARLMKGFHNLLSKDTESIFLVRYNAIRNVKSMDENIRKKIFPALKLHGDLLIDAGLLEKEVKTVREIEELVNKKFKVHERTELRSLGFTVRNDHVLIMSIAYCGLKELPKSFGNLNCLIMLDLSGNVFTSLPKSFSKLRNLRRLKLNEEQQKLIPKTIKTLEKLKIDSPNRLKKPLTFFQPRNSGTGMRIITVNVPEAYLAGLEQLIGGNNGIYPSRSEAIRVAIRDFIRNELLTKNKNKKNKKNEKKT